MKTRLRELAFLFFKLGTVAFGGPAAHIAMMEDEVVNRRSWITHQHFLDMLGATNLIPGPNSTEMAIHVGYVKAGWKGLIVAGACFIFPSFVITLVCARLYVEFGSVPEATRIMWGIRAAVIAVIVAAVPRLGKPLVRNRFMLVLGLAVVALNLLHVDEVALLLGSGAVGLVWAMRDRLKQHPGTLLCLALLPPMVMFTPFALSGGGTDSPTLAGLGLFFLKIGSILYGSGYVLVAFLQGGLVETRHWLTQGQLVDAIAVGQLTPGPLSSTATFIGYQLLGLPGAAVATAGMFFPSFIFVFATSRFIPKLRKSPLAGGFLDGVNAASLGLMVAVCVTLGLTTLTGIRSWIIFALAAIILIRWNVHPAWIVAGSAIIGYLSSFGSI
ncbi:MAG: chromate efflux transporter [Bacteroidota bacterium]|jgi:chromate transporter